MRPDRRDVAVEQRLRSHPDGPALELPPGEPSKSSRTTVRTAWLQ
jgi:hypothetical protein